MSVEIPPGVNSGPCGVTEKNILNVAGDVPQVHRHEPDLQRLLFVGDEHGLLAGPDRNASPEEGAAVRAAPRGLPLLAAEEPVPPLSLAPARNRLSAQSQ